MKEGEERRRGVQQGGGGGGETTRCIPALILFFEASASASAVIRTRCSPASKGERDACSNSSTAIHSPSF